MEKFLSKRYNLIAETGVSRELEELSKTNCRIELKTTRKKKTNVTGASVGANTGASTGSLEQNEVSTSQLLLGLGRPGLLELDGRALNVTCSGGYKGIYQLVFFYSEQWRSKVSSEVTARQGEAINIGNITNDLNTKSKTLGLPESSYQSSTGSENINYELQIK